MQIKSLFKLGVIARLSLGLIAMAISIFLIADIIFGILPNKAFIDQTNRIYIAESLAVQFVSLIEEDDSKALNKSMQQITVRHPDIESIGIRRSDGWLTYHTANHAKNWLLSNQDSSTSNNMRVPIKTNETLWGNIEISFKSKKPESMIDAFLESELFWIAVIGLLGAGLIYAYLSRAIQYVDPTKSVPSRVNKAFDIIADGLLVLDKKGQIVMANKAFKDLSGSTDSKLFGKKTSELALTKPLLNQFSDERIPWEESSKNSMNVTDISLEAISNDGDPISLLVSSVPISDDEKESRGHLVTFKNISELEKTNKKLNSTLDELEDSRIKLELNNQHLQEMAYRDPLTGCLNRRAFFQQAEELYASASQGNRELYCVMADIDFFKSFNDLYGHHIGDQVITATAKILTSCVRPTDLICRYGGEEFCILLTDISDKGALEVCERMRTKIEQTANKAIRNTEIKPITSSFGLTSISSGASSIENLIEYADKALYASKENGRNKVTLWTSSLLN